MKEIERKFLIKENLLLPDLLNLECSSIDQGYLVSGEVSVRIRLLNPYNYKAFLTIKGPGTICRSEFEYEIPYSDGKELFKLCQTSIYKTRYKLDIGNHTWEIDKFEKSHAGLWLAEIELDFENEEFELPIWIDKEVTEDKRYSNAALAKAGPFSLLYKI